jgi:SAM-dependent methyltransferase
MEASHERHRAFTVRPRMTHRSSTTAVPEAPRAPRFHASHRTEVRAYRPWHRLAHIARVLPEGLEDLSRDLRLPPRGRVLDYGCADVPYRHFFPHDADYVGADLPGNPQASVDIAADGTLALPDASFDAVISTQVLEHVGDPAVYLSECFRLLRPGGRMLLSTHGMMVYHPDPVDLWRWTCEGLQRAVTEAGFHVARFEGIMGLLATGLQLVQDATYWKLPRLLRPLYALILQSLIALSDRLQSAENKRLNALVFALVAEKP